MEGADDRPLNSPKPHYTLAGVMFFLQQEARRYEKERSEWAVEKALLMSKVSQLEGEKVATQNLNNDLLKRIKMLEFALRQERSKYVSGAFTGLKDFNSTKSEPTSVNIPKPALNGKLPSSKNQKTRQVLQRYLTEISSTDKVMFPKQPLPDDKFDKEFAARAQAALTRDSMIFYRDDLRRRLEAERFNYEEEKSKREEAGAGNSSPLNNPIYEVDFADGTQTVRATDSRPKKDSDSLQQMFTEKTEEKLPLVEPEISEKTSHTSPVVEKDPKEQTKEPSPKEAKEASKEPQKELSSPPGAQAEASSADDSQESDDLTEEQMESMASKYNVSAGKLGKMMKAYDKPKKGGKKADKPKGKIPFEEAQPAEDKGKLSGLDELESLSVTDEQDYKPAEDSKDTQLKLPPKQWKPKSTLRGHLDSVRAVAFREHENVLLTASEDGTIKVWNTGALPTSKKSPEPEPFFTFRGHFSMILCLAVSDLKGSDPVCYTGSADGSIRMWNIPPSNYSIFTPYDEKYTSEVMGENLDAVWCLKTHPVRNLLASACANGTVKLWSSGSSKSLLTMEKVEQFNPTSVDFVHTDLKKLVGAYGNSAAHVFDIETGKSILSLDSKTTSDSSSRTQINSIISHPTLPLAITAHEDKYIRFFDLNSGKCVNSMIAHLDAVSSLAVNPNGLSLVSGGHDSSIRVWDIHSYACTQEFTSHRKKYSEGVHSLAFHPNIPILASSGADGTTRIYS